LEQLRPDEGLRPVMVWIHGGGFTMGSGNGENYLYGPKYFMNKDIVLVTVNYRLSSFGTHVITVHNSPVDDAMWPRLLFDRI
jgi:carboxylesterase type B